MEKVLEQIDLARAAGFTAAADQLVMKQERQRKLALAYEHYAYATREQLDQFQRRLYQATVKDFTVYTRTYDKLLFTSIGKYPGLPPGDVRADRHGDSPAGDPRDLGVSGRGLRAVEGPGPVPALPAPAEPGAARGRPGGGADRRPLHPSGQKRRSFPRRKAALSSGMDVLMNIPLPSSKPAVMEIRGTIDMYQWK